MSGQERESRLRAKYSGNRTIHVPHLIATGLVELGHLAPLAGRGRIA
jgi:hypothetical protein